MPMHAGGGVLPGRKHLFFHTLTPLTSQKQPSNCPYPPPQASHFLRKDCLLGKWWKLDSMPSFISTEGIVIALSSPEVVKHIRAVAPHVDGAVLPQALVVEAVDLEGNGARY